MAKTLQDIQTLIQEEGIRIVDFKLTDIDGRWRHLSIPAQRLNEGTMEHGIGFDGSIGEAAGTVGVGIDGLSRHPFQLSCSVGLGGFGQLVLFGIYDVAFS